MKLQLSKKVLTRLAICIAVAIVIIFIIWKFRGKSKYTVLSLQTATAGTLENAFYANISLCQNTFISSTLGNVNTFTSLTCAGGIVTATTTLPHRYTTNQTVYIQGASSNGMTANTTYGYNTTPGNPVPITVSGTDVRKFTYSTTGTAGCSTFPPLVQFGYSWLSTDNLTASANVLREGCILSNVNTYFNNKCPYTSTNPLATETTNYAYYTTYTNTHVQTIKDAYAYLILVAPTIATATTASLAQLQAAREADLTGATRYYLNSVCPMYYQITDRDPATVTMTGWPNTPYNAYGIGSNANSTATTGIVGFNPALVTNANVLNWAKYASTVSAFVTDAGGNYVGGGLFTGTAPLTTSTGAGDATRYTFSTGSTIFPSGTKNWEIAQDIGPGTVTTSGTIPGTITAAGTAVATSLTMHTA